MQQNSGPNSGMGSTHDSGSNLANNSSGSGPPSGGGGDAPFDPLAAMMAPPSRRMPNNLSAYGSMSSMPGGVASNQEGGGFDPLAAMMAPPSSNRGFPAVNNF